MFAPVSSVSLSMKMRHMSLAVCFDMVWGLIYSCGSKENSQSAWPLVRLLAARVDDPCVPSLRPELFSCMASEAET